MQVNIKMRNLLILFTLLLIGTVNAFDVTAIPERQYIKQEETATYTLKVENAKDGIYTLTTTSQNFNWITFPSNEINVKNGEATFKVLIRAPRDAAPGGHGFPIVIRSISDSNNVETYTVNVVVKSKEGIQIENVKSNKLVYSPDVPITLNVDIKSDEPLDRDVDIVFDIDDLNGNDLKIVKLKANIKKDSVSNYEQSFMFDEKLSPGEYPVTVIVQGDNKIYDSFETTFEVVSLYDIDKQKETSWTFFSVKNIIHVTNNGNAPAYDVKVSDNVPRFWSLFVTGEKDAVSLDTDSQIAFTWNLAAVNPNETKEISYSIVLWPIYLIVVMVSGLMFKGYSTYMVPIVNKGFYTKNTLKHGKYGSILINVKNKGFTKLNNVVVEDVIPSSFKVLETSVPKPKYKKTSRGYHLRWNLGTLLPGEERVFTYKIKNIIGVLGNVELPKAQMIANGTKIFKSKTPRTKGDDKKEKI